MVLVLMSMYIDFPRGARPYILATLRQSDAPESGDMASMAPQCRTGSQLPFLPPSTPNAHVVVLPRLSITHWPHLLRRIADCSRHALLVRRSGEDDAFRRGTGGRFQ